MPPPVELDPIDMPVRETASEAEHKMPEGFYVYEPVALPSATSSVGAVAPSSIDRRQALLDGIRTKDWANSIQGDDIPDVVPQRLASPRLMQTASIGNIVDAETDGGDS